MPQVICDNPLLSICAEADDVISSVHLNRHQLSTAWRRALVLAMHTSPVKQFGIGFGIGWSVSLTLSDIKCFGDVS